MAGPRDDVDVRAPVAPGPVPPILPPVLVVGTDDWAVEQAVARLAEAGATVFTCHDPGRPAFPCNALVGRGCPLDRGCDVVVTVRARPLDRPAPGEMGVVCGLHRGAALVSAGMAGSNPFGPWVTRAVTADEQLAVVVSDVVRSPRARPGRGRRAPGVRVP
ncbi:MAG TPA: hypothetical protein VJ622_08765 [Acidimicrobiia bacterium]|nr:hypothetical protein [Acidimicrobiia bacterium]HTC82208.1 hypothetical protein [Acidimicrobiia bacterium]